MDYVPTRTWAGNQIYLLSTVIAHNLSKELQMLTQPAERKTEAKRPTLWPSKKLAPIRVVHEITSGFGFRGAGRLIKPNGKLVLSMSHNAAVKQDVLQFLEGINQAA